MAAVDRLRRALTGAAVVLSVALIAAIVLGVAVLPALAPLAPSQVEGVPLVSAHGTGPIGGNATVVLRRHAVGIALRCTGGGDGRVELPGLGSAGGACDPDGIGGAVLSGVPNGRYSWAVAVPNGVRWSLVLSDPATVDGALTP